MSSDSHSTQTRLDAAYSDGETAASHDVVLSLDGGELRIESDQLSVRWPVKAVRLLSHIPGEPFILGHKRTDERLVLDPASETVLTAWFPALLDTRRRRRGTLYLGGSLTGLAAGLAAAFFFGIPALSGPLAQQVPLDVEERMGEQTNTMIGFFARECVHSDLARSELDRIATEFSQASQSPFPLQIRIVDAEFPNAFAMPGGRIIVTDELIELMNTPEEFLGVLAHETAHVAQRHVMAAQLRQLGSGMVLELLIGGGSGAGQELARAGASVEGLRHSRSAEREADALGIAYMDALDIDPDGMARFFEVLEAYIDDQRIAAEAGPDGDPHWLDSLLSSHPDTQVRAERAREAAAALNWSGNAAMSEPAWQAINEVCTSEDAEEKSDPLDVLETLRDRLRENGLDVEEGSKSKPDPDTQD